MTHRPQLFIDKTPLKDQKLQEEIFKETDKYSITPRTFHSRNYQKEIDSKELSKMINRLKFTVTEAQEKLKEKIDKITQELQQDVDAKLITVAQQKKLLGELGKNELYSFYRTREEELKQYQEKIGLITQFDYQDLSIFVDTYQNNPGNVVCRYGLNSLVLVDTVKSYNAVLQQKGPPLNQKSGNSSKTELPKTVLHPLEIITIIKAIKYMQEETKTALIDIFVRDDIVKGDKEKIKFDIKTGLPETHTVVLYQNSSGDIVLIDPSNSDFSKHLASEMSSLLVSGELMDQTLKVPTKEIKIYTPGKDIGPGTNQYRDCIDIAVKIAFGLNNYTGIIEVSKVMELPAIKEITNQKIINEAFVPNYEAARIRQASNDEIRKIADQIMGLLNQQRKGLAQHNNSSDVEKIILQQNIDSFKSSSSMPDKYKEGLKTLLSAYKNNEIEISNFKMGFTDSIDKEIKEIVDVLGEQADPLI